MSTHILFDRRQIVLGLVAVGALLSTGCDPGIETGPYGPKERELARLIRAAYKGVGVELGRVYIEGGDGGSLTESAVMTAMRESPGFDAQIVIAGSPEATRAMLKTVVQADFDEGRVDVVSGFILARTELLVAALVSFG